MKKILLVFVLVAIIVTGTAFAADPRPKGLGIGASWGYDGGWSGGGGNNGANLALKLPSLDPYLGVSLRLGGGNNYSWFSVGATFDWNMVGGDLASILGWYIDLGGYVGFWASSTSGNSANDWSRVNLGLRLPIGLTIKPIEILDIFVAFVPSIGLGLRVSGDAGDDFHFPDGGWGFNVGIRLWL